MSYGASTPLLFPQHCTPYGSIQCPLSSLDSSNGSQLMLLLLNWCLISDQAPSQEKCQERNSVLSDGLRCQRYRYVCLNLFILFNWHRLTSSLSRTQDARPLSTPFASNRCWNPRTPMMPPMLISKKESASSRLQLVSWCLRAFPGLHGMLIMAHRTRIG